MKGLSCGRPPERYSVQWKVSFPRWFQWTSGPKLASLNVKQSGGTLPHALPHTQMTPLSICGRPELLPNSRFGGSLIQDGRARLDSSLQIQTLPRHRSSPGCLPARNRCCCFFFLSQPMRNSSNVQGLIDNPVPLCLINFEPIPVLRPCGLAVKGHV